MFSLAVKKVVPHLAKMVTTASRTAGFDLSCCELIGSSVVGDELHSPGRLTFVTGIQCLLHLS